MFVETILLYSKIFIQGVTLMFSYVTQMGGIGKSVMGHYIGRGGDKIDEIWRYVIIEQPQTSAHFL